MNNYRKIIIISQAPFSKRDYLKFGAECFIKNGFEVYFWDVNSALYPKNADDIVDPNFELFSNIIKFSTKKEVLRGLNTLSNDAIIILYAGINYNTLWIYRALKKRSLDYVVTTLGDIPSPKVNNKSLKSNHLKKMNISYIYNKFNIRDVFNYFIRNILSKKFFRYLGIMPAKILIVGGKKAIELNEYFLDENTHICLAHSFDYDRYLDDLNRPQTYCSNKKYAVFLDQFLPFHPDSLYFGDPIVSKSEYYSSLSNFFDYVSLELGVDIIIAAHPCSYYDKLPDYFNGRKIIIGETDKLVQMSEFVIMHSSTAINFAVLHYKPIIFITTNEIDKTEYGFLIENWATAFDVDVVNVDEYDCVDLSSFMHINYEKWDQYINEYIKIEGTPQKSIWEIFIAENLK